MGLLMILLVNTTLVQARTDPVALNNNVTLNSVKYAGTDGTCQWYISNDNVLHIKSGSLTSGSLGKTLMVDETKYSKERFDDEKQDIKKIVFDGNVFLPQDSSWLFTGLGNNLDGTSGLIAIEDADRVNTSSVEDMSHMFDSLSSLKLVDVSTWDVSQVQSMKYMFSNTGLATVDISNWNTGNVQNMRGMFSSKADSQLESLNVSAWNVSRVRDMSDMFMKADQLRTLDVSKWNIINVQKMNHMFSGAQNIKKLDFSNWDNKNITATGFLSGTNLSRIILSPNFSIRHSYLGQDLSGNNNLQTWLITDKNGNKRVVKSNKLLKSKYAGVAINAKNLAIFDVNVPNNLNERIVNKNVRGGLKNGTATLTIKVPQKSGYKASKKLITFTVNVAKIQATKGRYIVSSPEKVIYKKINSKRQISSEDNLLTTLPNKKAYLYNDDTEKTVDTLTPQTNWFSDKKMKDGYYRVATDKWVRSDAVYVYQPQSLIVSLSNNSKLVNAQDKTIPKKSLLAQTNWQVDRLAYLKGKTYYRVATNKFVPTSNVSVLK